MCVCARLCRMCMKSRGWYGDVSFNHFSSLFETGSFNLWACRFDSAWLTSWLFPRIYASIPNPVLGLQAGKHHTHWAISLALRYASFEPCLPQPKKKKKNYINKEEKASVKIVHIYEIWVKDENNLIITWYKDFELQHIRRLYSIFGLGSNYFSLRT